MQTRETKNITYHLSNVLTVITDEKWMVLNGSNYSHYESVVVSVTDYSPFGVSLTGRTFTTTEGYRYGFQNQETDKELWDGAVSYKYRIEDVRLGRFFSVDPLYAKYPWNSNYAFSENRLIDALELEGAECVLKIDVESFMANGIICLDVSDALDVTATYSYGLYNITATISAEGATSGEIESFTNFDKIRSRANLQFIRYLCNDVGKMFCDRLTNFNNSKQKFQPYDMGNDISGLNDTYRHLLGVTLSVLVNGIGDTRYFFEAHERFEEKERLKVHDVNFIADIINNEIAIEFANSLLDDFCQKSDVTTEKVCQMINTLGSRVMDQYWSSEFADGEDSVIGYFEFTTDDKVIQDVADFLKFNLPEEGE